MSQNRLGNIDALRGFAALAVFVQHGFMVVAEEGGAFSAFAGAALSTIDTGRLGVVVFFLISGFVVPFSFKADRAVTRFVVTRLCRLYPAYWISLVAASVVLTFFGQAPSLEQVIANGTMAAPLFGEAWISGVYWTLFIELLFYGAVVVLFVMGVLYRPVVIAGLGALLALTSVMPILMPAFPLPVQYFGLHLSVLFSGLLLRLALLERRRSAAMLAGLLFVVQMASVWVAADYALQTARGFAMFSMSSTISAYVLGFAIFLAVAILVPRDVRVMAHFAAISYSVYLLHDVIIEAMFHVAPPSGGWADVVALGVVLLLSVGAASLVYRWVERPFMAFGRWIFAYSHRPLATA